jgi:hypothetical protein
MNPACHQNTWTARRRNLASTFGALGRATGSFDLGRGNPVCNLYELSGNYTGFAEARLENDYPGATALIIALQ